VTSDLCVYQLIPSKWRHLLKFLVRNIKEQPIVNALHSKSTWSACSRMLIAFGKTASVIFVFQALHRAAILNFQKRPIDSNSINNDHYKINFITIYPLEF